MLKAKVEVRLKKGVVDPEGKNITKALHLLHFNEVKEVKVAKVFEIFIADEKKEEAMKKVDEMCKKLLANPVINEYSISIEEIHD
ncbi:phosphoribosylformylglycinamidine synthase [Thermoplasmatales archaeon ex4484_30]|nr:MAG: phosphoribosylformylglycinamidine synthase subunit PurS [Thermoplasmata archaeon]OYT59221.1 MAG: phosphoribosylformylglycinamidine synthase [Thermoplasmatales archaeon ex4484_30]